MEMDVRSSYLFSIPGLRRRSFILEGLLTVLIGAVSYFLMADFPEKAKFLQENERSWVLHRVKYRGSSGPNKVAETDQFKWKYVWAAFLDWQIWLAIITDMAASCTIYGKTSSTLHKRSHSLIIDNYYAGMSAFLPSIVAELGYSGTQANLLTIPPYVCSCLLTILLSWLSDRKKNRSTFILVTLAGEFVGYSLALGGSAAGIHGLAYAGVFISTSCCYPCFILIIVSNIHCMHLTSTVLMIQQTWIMCNLAPSYKRAAGAAVLVGIGNMSGPMGSNFYRDEDAPKYLLGHGLELMMVTLGLITATILLLCYKRINKQREQQLAEGVNYSEEELSDMGDRAPTFRYYL